MSTDAVAGIAFDLTFDGSKMMTSINSSCNKIKEKFTKSFTEAGKAAKTTIETSNSEIRTILDDTTRSAKSKAATIAAIYKKEGCSMSEAMKKAWSHIERESNSGAESTQKDMKGMSKQSQKTAKEIEGNLSNSFVRFAKKAAVAFATAFSVKKLLDFGADCVKLGSDLQEVQNVVDVTFPSMNKQINKFAQNAAVSFGLSETMAKKFSGTFGAMAKSFGFSEKAAYDMSTTLTGLAGDVASFYNITQDEAYTKLTSVFTGETESIKELGVVMTQTALDSYALANGFGKTTAKMSEAEKVALRYQFVQEKLAGAAGDFIRTSDSWANQVKVLSLQFDSLKATIGQGLINVLTPVIKMINILVGKLMTLANAFKSFTESITGKKETGDAESQMKATALAADSAAASTEAIGDAAAASAKKMKALYSFDKMNVISSDTDSGGTSGGYDVESFNMESADTSAIDAVDSKYQSLIDKTKELADLFKQGFHFGLGDVGVLDSIKQSIHSIGEQFVGILSAIEVTNAAGNFVRTIVESWGKQVGSAVSVGASIADNFLGGLSEYLESDSGKIQDYIVSIFDIGSRISEIKGVFSVAVGTIAESLRSEGAIQITESLISSFSNAFMGVTEICGKWAANFMGVITGPFVDNQDLIRTTLEETFSALAPVFVNIKGTIGECVATMQAAYDEHISPLFTSLKSGLTEVSGALLVAWSKHVLPVIESLSAKLSEFKEQYLSPLIEKFGEFAGKVADAVEAVWTNGLKPAIEEFIVTWTPVIGAAIEGIGQFFTDVGAAISAVLDGIMTALGGLMDFVTGVFTGDWNLAWKGIKTFFIGIWNAMKSTGEELLNAIANTIKSVLNFIETYFQAKFNNIKNTVNTALGNIREGISAALNNVKNIWNNVWSSMKNTVVNIFNGIWNAIKNIINRILGGVESMANGIVRGLNRSIDAFNRIRFSIPEWVPELGGKSFGISISKLPEISIPKLAQGGFVKANTPQLAMIGDNLHQGEVVAPENKIYEVSAQAMRDVMKEFTPFLTSIIGSTNKGQAIVLKVTGEMAPFIRLLKAELQKEESRTGINFEVVYE